MDIICEKLLKNYPTLGNNARVFRAGCIERQINVEGCCRKVKCKTGEKVLEEENKRHLKPPTKKNKDAERHRRYFQQYRHKGRWTVYRDRQNEKKRQERIESQAEQLMRVMQHHTMQDITNRLDVPYSEIEKVLRREGGLPSSVSRKLNNF